MTRIQHIVHVYIGSLCVFGFCGEVVTEGLRGVEECECPDTVERPRESDGRDSRDVDDGNLAESGVLIGKRSVEGSAVTVGMLRRKYCSVGKDGSVVGAELSSTGVYEKLGLNSKASGLSEK